MIQKFIWLQAFAQVPDLHVWYGPDSYMGANLAQLFTSLAFASDAEVQALHPGHTAASVRSLLPRLHHFTEGICIVHHMFGSEVTDLVKSAYPDAYLAAHFEVRDNLLALWLIGAICFFCLGNLCKCELSVLMSSAAALLSVISFLAFEHRRGMCHLLA